MAISPSISSALNASLQTITPRRVAAAVVAIDGSHEVFDSEARAVERAIPSRKDEFKAGRAAARHALHQLGSEPVAIPRAEDRRPLWPAGFVGSISHTRQHAAAAAAHARDIQGLGLDIEDSTPLKTALLPRILTPLEQAQQAASPMVGDVPRCKLTFVAKEALFKSIHPLGRRFFGFQDAEVELHPDGSWRAHFAEAAVGLPEGFTSRDGRWCQVEDLLMAVVCLVRTGA